MIKTYDEYIRLLEAEVSANGYAPLYESAISAFIKKYELDKHPGIDAKDVRTDVRMLINQHYSKERKSSIATEAVKVYNTSLPKSDKQRATMSLAGQLSGLSKKRYQLESKAFSSGGEGDIYKVVGNDSQVVKLYHSDRITSELEQKIIYMAKNPPASSVLDQVAWPIDALYNDRGQFVGFVMPKLDITSELGDVYTYPPTKPEAQLAYNYKLILAMNICTVINAVHDAGYVFGDFNPRNIGININTGRVAFLDTDSYHIVINEKQNKAFRCKVCLDGYVAPELLAHCEPYKKDAYASAPLPTFTKETDNFALAIHIFKLLMNGFTPFNGIKETDTLSTASPGNGNQAIKRDNYCFKPGNKPLASAVPDASILPKAVENLFKDAFILGRKDPKKRPTAKQWFSALENYENELKQCSKNPIHLYKKSLKSCPWCEADAKFTASISRPMSQRSFPAPPVIAPPTTNAKRTSSTGSAPVNSYNSNVLTTAASNRAAIQPVVSRDERIKKVATVLYPIAWILFLLSIVYCVSPYISNGSFSFSNSSLFHADYRKCIFFAVGSVGLLTIAEKLKNSSSLGTIFAWIWSFIASFLIATMAYTQMGYNATSASRTWKLFGFFIAIFIAALVGGSKIGTRIRVGKVKKQARYKITFRAIDIVFLIMLIATCAFCIPLLLDLSKLYSFANTYNLFGIGLWVAPIVFFIIFVATTTNEIVDSWFCATMAILFECAVLRLGALKGTGSLFGWFGLAIVALLLIFYLMNEVDNIVSTINMVAFFVFFFAGAGSVLKIVGNGVTAVGEGAHWFSVAPGIIVVIVAAIFSIGKLIDR